MKGAKLFKFFLVGIFFGVVLTKSEVISWIRIYEMFHFASFHMFGVIGSAVGVGVIIVQLIKRLNWKTLQGTRMLLLDKPMHWKQYILGGTIFGFGWAMTGACPGPMFALLGNGLLVMGVAILSATLGTLAYGIMRKYLPH
jgi:uncharacterized membrane protein YedE/YeeE